MNRKNIKEIKDKNRRREDKNKVLKEKRCRKKMKIRKKSIERGRRLRKINEDALKQVFAIEIIRSH